MSRFVTVVTAFAVCTTFSIALAGDDMKMHGALKHHANFAKAERELFGAFEAISKSQTANECVFGLEGGHGAKAKEEIETARKEVYEAAEWANTHEKECAAWKAKPSKFGEPRLKGHPALKGHGALIAAEKHLIDAWDAVARSQAANECVFGVEGGHGEKAKAAIDKAYHQVYDAAEYVNTHPEACKK
jgi:hypothetical protein